MSAVELGSLFEFIRNGMNIKQDKSGEGLPITRIETIWNGYVDDSRVGFANLKLDDCREWLLYPGDILFSHINSVEHIGKCAIYRGSPKYLVHGMNLLCLRCNQKKLIPAYARWLIRSSEFRSKLSNFINKAVNQASVSIGNLKQIMVRVPHVEEQRRIAAILDKAEALRAKRRQTLAKLDTLTQSLFLQMFGDPRMNSKRWPTKKLGEVGVLERGISKHRPRNAPELLNGAYPLIQTGDIANSNGRVTGYSSSYSEKGLEQSRLWPVGTLCITIAANIAKTATLGIKACFPDSIVGFVPHDFMTTEFVQVWFAFFQKALENNAPESAQKNINLAILRDIEIIVPPHAKQREFTAVIGKFYEMQEQLFVSVQHMEHLALSLQHQAFRGDL